MVRAGGGDTWFKEGGSFGGGTWRGAAVALPTSEGGGGVTWVRGRGGWGGSDLSWSRRSPIHLVLCPAERCREADLNLLRLRYGGEL